MLFVHSVALYCLRFQECVNTVTLPTPAPDNTFPSKLCLGVGISMLAWCSLSVLQSFVGACLFVSPFLILEAQLVQSYVEKQKHWLERVHGYVVCYSIANIAYTSMCVYMSRDSHISSWCMTQRGNLNVYMYIYIYICIYVCIYIYNPY